MPSISTHVIVLAPSSLHREAWRALLSAQPGIEVRGVVGEASELSALLQTGHPTTILIDQPVPQSAWVRQLKSIAPDCGLLLIVQSFDLDEIVRLLQAGATGCVLSGATVGDLARGVIAAGREELVLPPTLATRALVALARGRKSETGQVESLSDRESEVLRLLAQGLTNKDIAQTLILSVRTIEAHLRSIYSKLGVRSRTEAALWAVRRGLGGDD